MNNLSRRLTSHVSCARMSFLQCSTIPNGGLGRYQISTPRAGKTDFLVLCQAGSKIFLPEHRRGGGGGGRGCTLLFSVSPLQRKKIQVLCSIKKCYSCVELHSVLSTILDFLSLSLSMCDVVRDAPRRLFQAVRCVQASLGSLHDFFLCSKASSWF